jgi:hypothetical protein
MQVHELAKAVGVGSKELADYLGKSSHMQSATEEDVAKAEEKYGKATFETAAGNDKKIVRFWSNIRNLTYYTEYGAIYLRNWKLDVYDGSPAYNAIMAHHEINTRIVIDEPFKDTIERTAFREFLVGKAYTGLNDEPALKDGYAFLMALFQDDEKSEVAGLMEKGGMKAVIEYAVEHKSYKIT